MKKILLVIVIFMLSFIVGISQTTKKVTVKPDSIRKDSIYQYEKKDMNIVKMTDLERKKKEYLEYERKQRQISKNLDQMDKNIDVLDKQKATMDSVLLKRKIK
jgi:hypothetical protein